MRQAPGKVGGRETVLRSACHPPPPPPPSQIVLKPMTKLFRSNESFQYHRPCKEHAFKSYRFACVCMFLCCATNYKATPASRLEIKLPLICLQWCAVACVRTKKNENLIMFDWHLHLHSALKLPTCARVFVCYWCWHACDCGGLHWGHCVCRRDIIHIHVVKHWQRCFQKVSDDIAHTRTSLLLMCACQRWLGVCVCACMHMDVDRTRYWNRVASSVSFIIGCFFSYFSRLARIEQMACIVWHSH